LRLNSCKKPIKKKQNKKRPLEKSKGLFDVKKTRLLSGKVIFTQLIFPQK